MALKYYLLWEIIVDFFRGRQAVALFNYRPGAGNTVDQWSQQGKESYQIRRSDHGEWRPDLVVIGIPEFNMENVDLPVWFVIWN